MTRDELVNELLASPVEERKSSKATEIVDQIIKETQEETGFTRWA